MVSKKVLKDVREDCDCEDVKYCPLEAMLCQVKDRVAEQHKLVEFAKYEWSKAENRELKWEESYMRWIELGYAKHFSEIYSPEKTYHEMRMELFKR